MDVYETRKRDWEDLDMTREELQNLTECMKKEEFRKLLIEYAEEVTDPENRKTYEREITQLEKERGVDVTFVNPEPGYVIKTSLNGLRKCFINISKSDIVQRPSSQPSYDQGHRGLQWSIPYTLVPPRDDLDKKNLRCTVFDVVFHPDTLYLASKNSRFREIVNNTAMDGVEKNFKVELDRKNLKFPKMNFKGTTHPTVIRKPSKDPPKETLDMEPEIYQKLISSYDESRERQSLRTKEKPQRTAPQTVYYKEEKVNADSENSEYATPKFTIKHQTELEMQDFSNDRDAKFHAAIPKKLVIIVDLPLLRNATDATLDVQDRSLTLKSEKPAKYFLDLPLPYYVDADRGNAKFDSKYKKLTVTLPVIRKAVPAIDCREDSGVDSDHGSPVPRDSKESGKDTFIVKQTINSESNSETDCEGIPAYVVQKEGLIRDNSRVLPTELNESNTGYQTELKEETGTQEDIHKSLHERLNEVEKSDEHLSDPSGKRTDSEDSSAIVVLSHESETTNEFNETALRTSDLIKTDNLFMNPNIKYSLPVFHCNVYDNQLVITVSVKNVDPDSIQHRFLEKNVGIHVLLTSVGAGFFPIYYSLCLKMEENHPMLPDSLAIDPWDNNIVFTVDFKGSENILHYYFGLDEEFMEQKEVPALASFENKQTELTSILSAEEENKEVKAEARNKNIIASIRANQLDSDDEDEHENTQLSVRKQDRKHLMEKARSVSESSGDELPSSGTRRSKGILKLRRTDFSRSVSESSADETSIPVSSADFHYDSVLDVNSESDCSSLKKTVRFNDVVSRQLFRSNSSILGQRKKNQRKLRNKKRAHDRRMSESENSETDEKDKFKVHQKRTSEQDINVKPILNREKLPDHERTANIKIDKSNVNVKFPLPKRKPNSIEEEVTSDTSTNVLKEESKCSVPTEFKNDLIFDLDM